MTAETGLEGAHEAKYFSSRRLTLREYGLGMILLELRNRLYDRLNCLSLAGMSEDQEVELLESMQEWTPSLVDEAADTCKIITDRQQFFSEKRWRGRESALNKLFGKIRKQMTEILNCLSEAEEESIITQFANGEKRMELEAGATQIDLDEIIEHFHSNRQFSAHVVTRLETCLTAYFGTTSRGVSITKLINDLPRLVAIKSYGRETHKVLLAYLQFRGIDIKGLEFDALRKQK